MVTETNMPELEASDIRARVVMLEHGAQKMDTRLTDIEKWRSKAEIDDAVRAEQWTGVKVRLDNIDKNTGWLVKTIIGGLLIAVIAFIIRGGIAPLP